MKIKIRHSVFETNSSSMHSLAIDQMFNEAEPTDEEIKAEMLTLFKHAIDDNILYVCDLDASYDFGWGYDVFRDSAHKFMYCLADLYDDDASVNDPSSDFNMLRKWGTEFLGLKEIHLSKYPKSKDDDDWESDHKYAIPDIDHQSVGTTNNLLANGISMIDFIKSPKYLLIIDNDNH